MKESNKYIKRIDKHGEYIEMFDKNDRTFIFDIEDLENIISLKTDKGNYVTWYVARTGTTSDGSRDLFYVASRNNQKTIYLHAFLMNNIGKGKGQNSVDHIDRNPLNNRRHNLRIVTQSVQNQNTGKRSRKKNARTLPDGITQNDLPKYIVYYYEKQNNELGYRDYFKIEKHPVQMKGLFKNKWTTTKSMKKTPRYKLELAVEQLKELDSLNNEYNQT